MNKEQQVRSVDAQADWTVRSISLPGHVMVLTATGWQRGWLIAREHAPSGWRGLVQYEAGGSEITEYLPADHIGSPDIWLSGEPAAEQETPPGSTV